MKKLLILIAIISAGLSVNSEEISTTNLADTDNITKEVLSENPDTEQPSDVTIKLEAVFDWVDISQIERDQKITQYKEILFQNEEPTNVKKRVFRQKYADFLKDENWKEHYRLAKLGVQETEEAKLCAFFLKKDLLLIYALQYKNNPQRVYYYNAYGSLQYVDEISENYPNFPYTSKQYKKNGKLISAIYFTSQDTQYMYGPDGEFTGLWHKNKMFDKNGKQKVIRTNW